MPVKTVGTAAGRMTFWNSRGDDRPIDRADLINSGSTFWTPLMVFNRIGQTQA